MLRQFRQSLGKPLLFGTYGAIGCLLAATLLGELFLRLTKLPPTSQTISQDIVLVIDTSSSMEGEKLQEVKTAAQNFVDRFLDKTQQTQPPTSIASGNQASPSRLAVVGFGSDAQVQSSLTTDANALKQAIANLDSSGGTRMDLGLQAAIQALEQNQALLSTTDRPLNILLFTDGKPSPQAPLRVGGCHVRTGCHR